MPPKRKLSRSSPSSQTASPRTARNKVIKSCATCHARKVRCDLGTPACGACIRHAKTLGTAILPCSYSVDPRPFQLQSLPSPPAEAHLDELVGPGGRSLRKLQSRLARPDYREPDTDEVSEDSHAAPGEASTEHEHEQKTQPTFIWTPTKRVKHEKVEDDGRGRFAGVGTAQDVRCFVDRPAVGMPQNSSIAHPMQETRYWHAPPRSQPPTPATSPMCTSQPFFTSLFSEQQHFSLAQAPKSSATPYDDGSSFGTQWHEAPPPTYFPPPGAHHPQQWSFHPGLEMYTPPQTSSASFSSAYSQGYYEPGPSYATGAIETAWQDSCPFLPQTF